MYRAHKRRRPVFTARRFTQVPQRGIHEIPEQTRHKDARSALPSSFPHPTIDLKTHFIKLYLSTRKVNVGPVGSLAIRKCTLLASVSVKTMIWVTPRGCAMTR